MASNVNHPAASPASASGRSMLNRLERTASHVHNFVRRQRNEGTGLNEAEDDDDDFVRRLSSTFQTQRSCSPSSKKKKKASRGRPTDILSVKLTCLSSPETKITSNLDVNRLKRMGLGYHDSEIKLTGRVPTKLDLSMTSADFNQKLCNMFPILTNVAFELMTARKSKLESLPSSVNTPALIKELMSKEGRSGCLFIRPFTDITARCLQDFDMNAQPAVPLVDQAAGTSSRRSSAATSTSVVQKETLLEERALVATQNAEFQQSLITDQEKVRRLQNARKEIEEKEKKMLEFRNGKKRNLPEEPEEGIKLKFKTNTSWFDTTRKFLPEDNVQVLQDFICSLEDSSKKYVLTIPNRPPMKSSFCHGTLADLGISGNTLIQIQWLDDSKVVMEGESPENEELDDLLPPLVVQQRTRRRAAQHAEQIISRACVDIGVADTSSSDEEIVLDKEASGSNPAISSNLTLPLDQGNEEIGESGIPQVSNQEFQVEFENVHENAMNAEVPVLLPQPSTDKLQMALKSFAKEVLGNRVDGSMRMVIRRQTALDDALQNVARAQNRLLQPISVRFIGESAVDEGGPSRELSSEIVVQIKHSSCVEGPENNQRLRYDFNMYDTKKYLHIGQLTAILLLQGGQGLPIFNHSVAHYIIYEKITNCHEDLPKNMRKAFDQLKDMSNNQISRCIDDLLPNRFEEGYSVPSCKIEQSHLPRIIQAMVAHHIIQPQKMILDQFLQGLQIGGLLEVLRSHQKESYSLFKGSDVHLTADVFENMLKFKYDMIIPGSNNMAIAQAIEQGCFLLLQAAESGEAKFLVDETSLNVTLSSILKWLTGATRIPAVGLDSKIEVLFDPTAVLPRVNTCSLQLYMPLLSKFSDPEMVMKTIAEWITNSVGFGLV